MLNAVRIPAGVNDLKVRKALLSDFGIEIGGGLGQFAGKVWRVGLMGHSARAENILLCVSALEAVLSDLKAPIHTGVALAAVQQSLQS